MVAALLPRLERLERQMATPGWEDAYAQVDHRPPPTTVLEWAERHRRIDDQPFSLARFAPLRAIYLDQHPHIAVIKPAQRGVSEWAINVTAFALEHGAQAWAEDKNGLNVAYVFPTQAALGDFSKERFNGLKSEGPHLATLLGGAEFDAVTFKQVSHSYLYLRGGWSESALLSFAADVLVLDEFDRMDPAAVALARRRLNASVIRREIDISTPTLPGKGIHALYLQSDQRVYEQVCLACGTWTAFDFHRDVRADGEPHATWQHWGSERLRHADIALVCPACQRSLSDQERCAEGRWRAQEPQVTGIRGYQVPALCWPFVSLARLAVAAVSQDPSELQEFYRSDLGLPYEPGGSRVTESMLKRLSAELEGGRLPAGPWHTTTMGVDVGSRYHYRVSSVGPGAKTYVRAMGSVGSWAELDTLMATYQVRQCVVDAYPEQHGCREWAARHRGRVMRADYPTDRALVGELYRIDEEESLVRINRTMAMDGVYAAIAGGLERWPALIHNDHEFEAQMKAPVRVTTTDERGQERAAWVHSAPDHLFHASVYDRIARLSLAKASLRAFSPGGGASGWSPEIGRRAR